MLTHEETWQGRNLKVILQLIMLDERGRLKVWMKCPPLASRSVGSSSYYSITNTAVKLLGKNCVLSPQNMFQVECTPYDDNANTTEGVWTLPL